MAEPKGLLVVPIGFRSDGTLRTLELTDSDELKIAIANAAAGLVGPHGWIGGAWQKQPINIGYSDRVVESFSGVSTGGAYTDATTTPVPEGEIHIASFISCFHVDTVNRAITLYSVGGGIACELEVYSAMAGSVVNINKTIFILKYGDYVRLRCWSLADTKTIYGAFWGYQVDIDL